MLQGYVASCEHIFSFMATWKYDSFNSWSCEKTKFAARVKGQGQKRMTHRVSSLRAFWRPKNTITDESWNSRSRLPSFERTHFLHFGGLKMWFFRVVKPMLQGYVASCEHIFSFMATWKCDNLNTRSKFKGRAKRPSPWPGSKVKVKNEWHIALAHFVHFGAQKIQLVPSLEIHVQGYLASSEHIFCILAAWNCDFCLVVKPMLQGYVASCEHILSFMATWKCDSFNSRSKFKGHSESTNSRPGSKVQGQGQTRMTHRLSSLRAFWRHENIFTSVSWNSRSRVPSFFNWRFLSGTPYLQRLHYANATNEFISSLYPP